MRDASGTKQDVIARQERMLRLAERDHDLTLKVLAAETGIPLPTLATWKRDTAMPAWALALDDFARKVEVARLMRDARSFGDYQRIAQIAGYKPGWAYHKWTARSRGHAHA